MPPQHASLSDFNSNLTDDVVYESEEITDNALKASSTKKIIGISEVKKHSKVDDCWTVINGYVYDISKVIKTHPGGFSKIFQSCGKDGTKYFRKVIH